MDSGEKEIRKAFEETITRNVKSVLDYSKQTRELVRDLEKKVSNLEAGQRNQNEIINNLRIQLAAVQTRVFSGGTG